MSSVESPSAVREESESALASSDSVIAADVAPEGQDTEPKSEAPLLEASELEIAQALLSGGPEAIRAFNERRQRLDTRLNLGRLNLAGANLSGANLSNCVLRYAKFTGAVLFGAHFEGSDLAGADFSNARLEGTSLKGARLLNCSLKEASLRWCDLRSADVRNANFEGASLNPCNLGNADLTGAQFSGEMLQELRSTVSALEASGDHPRRVFFALLSLCVFAVLTAAGASDVNMVVGLNDIKVPLLDTAVSPRGFFFLVPIACLALLSYVSAHIRQLERAAAGLPARFPDGATLAEKLTPWMQNIAPAAVERRAVLEDGSDANWSVPALSRRLLVAGTRWLVPATTTLMLLSYFRSRRSNEIALLALLALGTWIFSYVTWQPLGRASARAHLAFSVALVAIGLGVYAAGTASTGTFEARGQSLRNASIHDIRLLRAELSNVHLEGAVLKDIDLSGAILLGAHLQGGGGHGVTLFRARLGKADLRDTFYFRSSFSEAQLVDAKLNGADLRDVSLRGADLTRTDLSDAHVLCADVRNTDLRWLKFSANTQLGSLWCDAKPLLPAEAASATKVTEACAGLRPDCRERLLLLATTHAAAAPGACD